MGLGPAQTGTHEYRVRHNTDKPLVSTRLTLLLSMIFLSCIVLANAASVNAAALGVSKGEIQFLNVLKNGYAQDTFYVTTDSEDNLSVIIEFRGRPADWLSLETEGDLWMTKDRGQWVTVAIRPPADTPNGIYEGMIRVKTSPISTPTEGRLGSSIVASFALRTVVGVVGDEITACTQGGFGMPDTEEGQPIELKVILTNNGNVQIQPVVTLDIWDAARQNLIQTKEVRIPESILPTSTGKFFIRITDLALPVGQYWVDADIPLCNGDPVELELNVLEKGGVTDRGELLRIENPWVVNTSDIVNIRAIFKNTGERLVSAKFKGTINKDNAVVKVVDSDTLDVEPGVTMPIDIFFEPEDPGRYEIIGRVLYNNKYTREKSAILNVNPSDEYVEEAKRQRRITYLSFIPLIVLMIVILVLLILIKKKRRQHKHNQHKITRQKRHHKKKLHDW